MDVLGIGAAAQAVEGIAGAANSIIGRFFPDKTEAQKAEIAQEMQGIMNDYNLAQGQLDINKVEASSTNWFIAGGRPAVIWIAAIALALTYWPKAIVLTILWTMQAYAAVHSSVDITHVILPSFPDLGVTDLLGLLGSILGLGGMRTFEKFKSVQGNH